MKSISALVTVKWLAEKLASSAKNVRVLDGSWHLPSTKRNAREEYAREHIPGALFFDIDGCADKTSQLDHMLPKPAVFESYVGGLGINNDTHVVVYDNNDRFPVFSAQRVWWTFHAFGHTNVSVLEGGLRKWKGSNQAVTDAPADVTKEQFTANFNPGLVKSFEDVVAWLSDPSYALVDARPGGRFAGTAPEPRPDIKPGCIPGSLNLPFFDLLNEESQTFRSKEEILAIFEKLSIDLNKPMAVSCGSGITACMVALAAHVCGKEDVAIYDGAWTEYYKRATAEQMKDVPKD